MKKLVTILILLFTLIIPQSVQAHLVGQPPFFKINGKYCGYYSVPISSVSDFGLPQDQAPENYLVNQDLTFELDVAVLPVTKDIVNQTKFIWDFADGSSGEGLKNTHAYKKAGSYIIQITAQYKTDPSPQLLQSVLLNILPSKNYQLPKSVIMVNGWQSKDPLSDFLEVKFAQELNFDAAKSDGGNSNITAYFWDFGDQQSASKAIVTHKYNTNPYTVFPVLRVKTADGFIADNFVQIKEAQLLQKNPVGFVQNKVAPKAPNKTAGLDLLVKVLLGVMILAFLYITGFIISKIFKKRF